MINEVHCAFVLSEIGNCDIDNIDYNIAKKQPGFVHIVTGECISSFLIILLLMKLNKRI